MGRIRKTGPPHFFNRNDSVGRVLLQILLHDEASARRGP